MSSFWQGRQRPWFVLAPMADVTDAAFRRVIATQGKPDAFWTEFVSADGLYHTREIAKLPDEQNPLMLDLAFSTIEHPIIAQLFSARPEMMEYAAALARSLGFDGVDINMGCPDRSIEKQGAGAALMKHPQRAQELIRSAVRGVQGAIPVSVKTRIGYSKNELEHWLPMLLEAEPAVVTVHARTRKELSEVPARWEHVREAVAIRDRLGSDTLVFGNGDLIDLPDALTKARATGADGAMLGRAIFGNPFLFAPLSALTQDRDRWTPKQLAVIGAGHDDALKLRLLVEHCSLFEQLCPHKSFAVMKKHFKAYVQGFEGAKELRMRLMECDSAEAVRTVLTDALETGTTPLG